MLIAFSDRTKPQRLFNARSEHSKLILSNRNHKDKCFWLLLHAVLIVASLTAINNRMKTANSAQKNHTFIDDFVKNFSRPYTHQPWCSKYEVGRFWQSFMHCPAVCSISIKSATVLYVINKTRFDQEQDYWQVNVLCRQLLLSRFDSMAIKKIPEWKSGIAA